MFMIKSVIREVYLQVKQSYEIAFLMQLDLHSCISFTTTAVYIGFHRSHWQLEICTNLNLQYVLTQIVINVTELEEALATERHEYEDLTAKYEILEEEHVVTKAQLVMDKEAVQT